MQQFVGNEHYLLKSQLMYAYGCVHRCEINIGYWTFTLKSWFQCKVCIIVCNSLCEINVTHWSRNFNACFLGLVWIQLLRFTFAFSAFFFFSRAGFVDFSTLNNAAMPCLRTHKHHFSITFSLKMGPTVLFTHLKIILL